MELQGILLGGGLLILLGLCWFGLHYWSNKPMNNPDAHARITGNCGDTMELSFRISDGKVAQVRHWSNGCSISQQCIESAAMLTRGKTIEQLEAITMMDVLNIVGQLPDTHLHCAQLAETTLQHALKNYADGIGQ